MCATPYENPFPESPDAAMELLHKVLENKEVTTLFQPIVSLRDGSVYGYEALSRGPVGTPLHSPLALIRLADQCGMGVVLESLFLEKAVKNAGDLPVTAKLFLNINPAMFLDPAFQDNLAGSLKLFPGNLNRVVFELTEREIIKDLDTFQAAMDLYKRQNCHVAIDDVGAGYSGLNLISGLKPHYIKLDMNLIRGIDRDPIKQALVHGIAEFSALTNITAIAEGVETHEEMNKLIELNISCGQGFLLREPAGRMLPPRDGVAATIVKENKIKNRFFGAKIHEFRIKNIAGKTHVISPDFLSRDVDEIFRREKNIPGVCVVDKDRPVGVITRTKYYERMGGRFGYALNTNKSVNNIMDDDFMALDKKMTIDTASRLAMSRDPEKIYDFLILLDHGKYDGIVTIKDLLEKTIEIEVANAKHLNPLTELPGNILIDSTLEKMMAAKQDRCVLYIDLDNFKAYNDYLGFKHGDAVLRRLSVILRKNDAENRFVGHIGGDDFIMVADRDDADDVCLAVITEFDAAVREFYPPQDLTRGYITVKNRKSVEENFPLMSISVAGMHSILYENPYALAEAAADVKKLCKQQNGSAYLIEPPRNRERRGDTVALTLGDESLFVGMPDDDDGANPQIVPVERIIADVAEEYRAKYRAAMQ